MALPPSGPITLSDVNIELSHPATQTITLGSAEVRALADVPSGPISMSNLYGKSSSINIEYLVVAGGGGGCGSLTPSPTPIQDGGGGGAGGVIFGTALALGNLAITIGNGGAGGQSPAGTVGLPGQPSSIRDIATATGGAGANSNGGTSGNGYPGGAGHQYDGGGGGGAGAPGSPGSPSGGGYGGGNGGNGLQYAITGTNTYYGGGGGGAGGYSATPSVAGLGGGGNGSWGGPVGSGRGAGPGTNGLGGGGGGSFRGYDQGGAGGSGVVIIAYEGSPQYSGGTVNTTSRPGWTVHTFTQSGTLAKL